MPINPTYVFKKNLKKITKSSLYHLQRNQPNPIDNLWAFFGSLLALSVIGLLQILLKNGDSQDLLFLIGAFGATSVLLFGATNSPLCPAQKHDFWQPDLCNYRGNHLQDI